jgi:hypothetical protein
MSLNPSGYVIEARQHYRQEQKITSELIEETALTRAPNYKHPDGRIYASRPGEEYFAVSVSPLNPEFATQIEPKVLPLVNALLNKNYLPLSSCEGHGGSELFVRIVFGSKESADDFIIGLQGFPYLTLEYLETSANTLQYFENGKPKFRRMLPDERNDRYQEAQDINRMFKRSYTQVCYVTLSLYKLPKGIFKFYRRHKIKQHRAKNETQLIEQLIKKINAIEGYVL